MPLEHHAELFGDEVYLVEPEILEEEIGVDEVRKYPKSRAEVERDKPTTSTWNCNQCCILSIAKNAIRQVQQGPPAWRRHIHR